MNPVDLASLFHDDSNDPIIRYDRFDVASVKRQIDESGYAIVRDLVPVKRIELIKEFWLETFAKDEAHGRVTWSVYYGQKNNIGFSSDKFQHLFRAVDIPWNEPLHKETREVGLRMSALRNLAIDLDPLFGLRLFDKVGVFVTTSYYPPEKGMMEAHTDGGTGKVMLVHILAPLTFKGTDYADGGLVMWDRKGQQIDVDGQLRPGDVVIYDGSLKHEVLPIVAKEGKHVGRLQMFPIPTVFRSIDKDVRGLGAIPFAKFVYAKYAVTKNALLIALGRKGTLR